MADFCNRDFILKSNAIPLDSPYIKKARQNKIPIEMDASLFAKISKAQIIGITGTRGKSTVTHLIYETLKNAKSNFDVLLGGNIKGLATLPLIKKVRTDTIAVLELDSWQLQGFCDAKISPQIAVFTNFLPDHLNYYKGDMQAYFRDKANIFRFQNENDYLITSKTTLTQIKKYYKPKIKSKIILASPSNIPKNWRPKLIGDHNLENISLAIKALEIYLNNLDIPRKEALKIIKKGVEIFNPVPGRLEYLKSIKGVKIYNDNSSTTPEATMAALDAIYTGKKNIILIMGGTDKGLDMRTLIKKINQKCKAVILLNESGTKKIQKDIFALKRPRQNLEIRIEDDLKICVKEALNLAKRGNVILFSPAFASFGKYFKNEFDRGEQFVRIIQE